MYVVILTKCGHTGLRLHNILLLFDFIHVRMYKEFINLSMHNHILTIFINYHGKFSIHIIHTETEIHATIYGKKLEG